MKRPVVTFVFHQISLPDKQTDWDKKTGKAECVFHRYVRVYTRWSKTSVLNGHSATHPHVRVLVIYKTHTLTYKHTYEKEHVPR